MANEPDQSYQEEVDRRTAAMLDRFYAAGRHLRSYIAQPEVDAQLDWDLHLTARALLESGTSEKEASRLLSKHWKIGVREADEHVREAKDSNDLENKIESHAAEKAKESKAERIANLKKARTEGK